MRKRLFVSTAMLACTAVVAIPAEGPAPLVSAPVAVDSTHEVPSASGEDEVLVWNRIFNAAVLATTPAPNSLVTSRSAALVAAAVFDAVNGVDRRYKPIHVTARAPSSTSARAAAIQAAYVMLSRLYPAQAGPLTAHRDASLGVLASGGDGDSPPSVLRGVHWGHAVAESIWAARQSDGLTPTMAPFVGSATLGFWRPTPPANSSGSGPQFATMTPWVLTRPSQFRPAPPPTLASAEYAADYNETQTWGAATGSPRQAADSDVAVFWSGNGTLFWTRIATQLAAARDRSLVENAHLFAMLHIAMADASIACWDAKYRYQLWRPVTAIRSVDDDGNGSTAPDPSWTPFLTTSAHPEYPSGHSNLAGAAAVILSAVFGEGAAFDASSETMPGALRSFVGFSGATEEMADARVYGGMHFRTACVRGAALGATVAKYVLRHGLRPL
jgi:membrane-associated phospholipid phosphatase